MMYDDVAIMADAFVGLSCSQAQKASYHHGTVEDNMLVVDDYSFPVVNHYSP